jgi:rod shape-determining protein MreC
MHRLLAFLFRYRAFIVFVLLEGLCVAFIANNTSYQQAALLNSANTVVAGVMEASNDVSSYFGLRQANESLVKENARLRESLANRRNATTPEQLVFLPTSEKILIDSAEVEQKYEFLPAKVINNSVRRAKNSITIDRGKRDGVVPGMGVISPQGVVGKVKYVSERYAVVTSLLHTEMYISSVLQRTNELSTTQWDGRDPRHAKLLYVPRHVNVTAGDTVITSGYSGIFPKDILIGTVSEVQITENSTFYDITLNLSAEFGSLSHVYVVQNNFLSEQDSLEQHFRELYNIELDGQ